MQWNRSNILSEHLPHPRYGTPSLYCLKNMRPVLYFKFILLLCILFVSVTPVSIYMSPLLISTSIFKSELPYLLFCTRQSMMMASCFSNRASRIHRYRGLGAPLEVKTPLTEFFFCRGGFPLFGGRFVLSPLDEDLLIKAKNRTAIVLGAEVP